MTQFDESAARREFQRNPALQAEFGDESTYAAYQRGTAAGRIRPPITGRAVKAEPEPEPRRADEEQVSPPVQRFTSSAAPRRQRQALESRDAAKRQEVENRSTAKRQAAPDLRAIWDQHGPQSGRIQCAATMQRFKSFEEFEQHVASHSTEGTTHV